MWCKENENRALYKLGTALSRRCWGPLQGSGLELSLISRKGADHAQEEPGAWLREQQVQGPWGMG